ncbi:MAG: hypothetical protein HUU35_08365 [Armatimonadetes bacterium]|nr:hypothetical protein [Armatimonadota bacterium]
MRRRGGGYDHLLDHLERQIDLLLAERHRLYLLVSKGQRLRGMMQASAGMRPRIPTVDQAIRHLQERAAQLDLLIGRYYQHRDDLCILREADEFNRELEELADSPVSDPFGQFQLATDELDEETERLMAIAEAEDELNLLLRG